MPRQAIPIVERCRQFVEGKLPLYRLRRFAMDARCTGKTCTACVISEFLFDQTKSDNRPSDLSADEIRQRILAATLQGKIK